MGYAGLETTRNYVVAERLGVVLDLIADEDSTKKDIKDKFYELKMDRFKNLPKVIETPKEDGWDKKNLSLLKSFIS